MVILELKPLPVPLRIRWTRAEKALPRRIWLYVLQLQEGHYYVGQAGRPGNRIAEHFSGRGSSWTVRHRPIALVHLVELQTTSWRVAADIESDLTLRLMAQVGWRNVRGGKYIYCDMKRPPAALSSCASQGLAST